MNRNNLISRLAQLLGFTGLKFPKYPSSSSPRMMNLERTLARRLARQFAQSTRKI
jgi:hypothetical protein